MVDLTSIQTKLKTGQINADQAKAQLTRDLATSYGGFYTEQGNTPQFTNSYAQGQYQDALKTATNNLFSGVGTATVNGATGQYDSNGNFIKQSTTMNQTNVNNNGISSTTTNTNPVGFIPTTGNVSYETALANLKAGGLKGTDLQGAINILNNVYQRNSDGTTKSSLGTTSGTTGTTGDTSSGNTNTGTTSYPSTGSSNLDKLQDAYANWINGSISQGFTINPGLSIDNNTIAQFLTETASQLEPQFQQSLSKEIADVNSSLGNSVNQYLQSQGQTIQSFQSDLANQRNNAGSAGMYLGGGERAIEQGLANSTNRKLSSLQSSTELDIGNQLRTAGQQLGQGFGGANTFGANIPGVNGSASSLNTPNLYGANVGLQGGDSVFAGSANPSNALNFNYNPSTYQYGAIPGQFATDFSNLLNTTGQNYLKGQAVTGAYNVTSQYGNQLGLTPTT